MFSVSGGSVDGDGIVRRDRRLLRLLLAWSVALVVFVLVPVFVDLRPKLLPGVLLPYAPWDVLEQLEPFISLPLNYFILAQADLMNRRHKYSDQKNSAERTLIKLLFVVGGALYVDGHGMHFGAKIAKHAISQAQNPYDCFDKTTENDTGDPACDASFASYMYVRGTMEHTIGHYIYLSGAILMSVAHTLAFRSHLHAHSTEMETETESTTATSLSRAQKCMFYGAAVLYALLIAGVSIEFPKGFAVVIPLMVLHGSAIVYMATRSSRSKLDVETPGPSGWFTPARLRAVEFMKATFWFPAFDGRALVLQYYLVAYVVALVPIIGWVIHARGFVDRESSGMTL